MYRMILYRGGENVRSYDSLSVIGQLDIRDSLIGSTRFWMNDIEHSVKAYTSDHYAPMDGGAIKIQLDSIGVVYSHSTTWPGFVVVQANQDSINDLITMAIGAALRSHEIACWVGFIEEPKIETVDFTKIEVYDTTVSQP